LEAFQLFQGEAGLSQLFPNDRFNQHDVNAQITSNWQMCDTTGGHHPEGHTTGCFNPVTPRQT